MKGAYLKQIQRMHFGKEMEYFSLWNKCFQKISNERDFKGGCAEPVAHDFVFDFCPFQGIFQRRFENGKSVDDSKTALGYWKEYTLGTDRIVMNYGGGDTCWNGPERKVEVELVCGEKDSLTRVRENGRCQYELVFETPSACRTRDFRQDPFLAQYTIQTGKTAGDQRYSLPWWNVWSWIL